MVATPKKRIPKKKKIALVLSGGGTKAAAFHIGVAYALKEAGFDFCQGLKTDGALLLLLLFSLMPRSTPLVSQPARM